MSKFIRKDIMNFALPIFTEQAFIMVMGMVNAIMAGRLGKEAVSAIGIVDSINNLFIFFFSAMAVGGTVVVAQYAGQKNIDMANKAARNSLLFLVLFASASTLLISIFNTQIIQILYGSAEEVVTNYALTYFKITLFSYPLIALTTASLGVFRGVGDTKTPLKITITMNIINIILSYILIYGIKTTSLGVILPGFGVAGAAWGIALARASGALMAVYYLLNGSKGIKIVIDRNVRLDKEMLKSILGIGFPASVESLMFNAGKLISQVFIVGMGTVAVASNYVANSVVGLINIPGNALSITATALIGQYMGRGDSEGAEGTLKYLIKASTVCLFFLCVIMYPISHFLASLYTKSDEVIQVSSLLIRTAALMVPPFWALSFLVPAGLKGSGDAKYTMTVSMFSMWAFRITLGYLLGVPFKMGIMGVWIGMYVDWILRGALFYFRLSKGKWKENVVIKKLENIVPSE